MIYDDEDLEPHQTAAWPSIVREYRRGFAAGFTCGSAFALLGILFVLNFL
jgi:hypothetical protein